MHPRLLTWPIDVPTYGVLIATALMVGLWVVLRQARKAGLDATAIFDLVVAAVIAGLLGAKLTLFLQDWRAFTRDWHGLVDLLRSAGVFYGGFAAGLVTAIWYVRRARLPLWPTLDVVAPGLAIGQAIGRLGCFAAGCCYGRPTTGPWGVTFRDPFAFRTVGTPIDIPLHPTQLYESAAVLLLFLVLIWVAPRKRFHGMVMFLYAIGYASLRFAIEFYRGDSSRGLLFHGALSTSQVVAIAVVALSLAALPYVAKRQRLAGAAPQA